MKKKAIPIVGLLVFAGGNLFGTQQPPKSDAGAQAFFKITGQPAPDPDRPDGVDPSVWKPLGAGCGLIVRQRTGGMDEGDSYEGRLVCKLGSDWYPMFLAAPPPTITHSR